MPVVKVLVGLYNKPQETTSKQVQWSRHIHSHPNKKGREETQCHQGKKWTLQCGRFVNTMNLLHIKGEETTEVKPILFYCTQALDIHIKKTSDKTEQVYLVFTVWMTARSRSSSTCEDSNLSPSFSIGVILVGKRHFLWIYLSPGSRTRARGCSRMEELSRVWRRSPSGLETFRSNNNYNPAH